MSWRRERRDDDAMLPQCGREVAAWVRIPRPWRRQCCPPVPEEARNSIEPDQLRSHPMINVPWKNVSYRTASPDVPSQVANHHEETGRATPMLASLRDRGNDKIELLSDDLNHA